MDLEEPNHKETYDNINIINIKPILSKLSNDFSYQKSYIELLNITIKNSISGDEKEIKTLEKMNDMLPYLIEELGLPFCDLINNNPEILNYYCNIYLKNEKNSEKAKKILINFINVFNFLSIEINPSVDYIEKLKDHEPNLFKEIEDNKRLNKTELENLYDGILELFSIWRISINMEDNLENAFVKQFELSLEEKYDKINEMEKEQKYSKATIEFFKEKIQDIEISIKKMIKIKPKTFEKKLNKDNEVFPNKNDNNEISKFHSNPTNHNIPKNILKKNNTNNNDSNYNNITEFNASNDNNIDNEFNIEETLKKLKEIPLKNRTSFYKDELLAEGEDGYTEFKNFNFPLNEKQGEELKRQFCGFLNSNGGRLYLGINDQKIVKGVVLNYKRCDALRNLLVNYTYDFYPKCRLDKIKVYFIPIKNIQDNKFINNLFVVKIIVLQGEPYILYSMTNKGFNSSIRLQGQCANLTAEEIYKEIIKRGALQKNYEAINHNMNNEFKDPEPEVNYMENDNDDDGWIINEKKNSNGENKEVRRNKKKKMNKRDAFVVEVKNIDVNLDIKEVYDYFNGCGCVYKKFFSKNGKSRGYGVLKFSSEHLANSIINKYNQSKLGTNNIILKIKKNND